MDKEKVVTIIPDKQIIIDKSDLDLIHKQYKDKITELEAKITESEKDRLMWQEMYKSADRQNKSICETDIYPLQEENQQLKDKLEIKLEELHIAYCGIENVKTKNGNLKAEVKKLKQQCQECKHINKKIELNIKNKLMNEIDQLKQQIIEEKNRNKKLNHEAQKYYEDAYCNGFQNQTAIAELNNILDTFAIFVNEEKESMVSPDGSGNLSLLEYVENRIDALKGESK